MKHACLFLTVFILSAHCLFAKQICLNIPDNDVKIVETDVVDAEEWIKGAWAGKLNKSKERLIKGELNMSIKEATEGGGGGDPIPLTEEAIINKAFSRPDYKSRKERDAEFFKKSDDKTLVK